MKQDTNDDGRVLCLECNRPYVKGEDNKSGLCQDCEEDFGRELEEFDDNGCEECGAPINNGAGGLCLQCKLDKLEDDK